MPELYVTGSADSLLTFGDTPPEPPPVERITGWLALHKAAGGYQNTPPGMPCVLPGTNALPIEFTKDKQLASWDLMSTHNKVVTRSKWAKVYDDKVAFCNEQGLGNPDDPRADYVNGNNLSYPNPKLMKAIFCAGSFTTGTPGYSLLRTLQNFAGLLRELQARPQGFLSALPRKLAALVTNNILICRPGVDGIDANAPTPTAATIYQEHKFFYAVTLGWNDPTKISHFPQGSDASIDYYGPVLIPRFLRQETQYPLEWFMPWDDVVYPDPLTIYYP